MSSTKLTTAEESKRKDALLAATALKSDEKPVIVGVPNANPEYDAYVARGIAVSKLWDKADRQQGSADARAVMLIIEAHRWGFFDADVNPAVAHKIGTGKLKNLYMNRVLTSLFAIDKPSKADRQRLSRIRLVVPALLKATTGIKVDAICQLSASKHQILLKIATPYFKKCAAKVEGSDKFGLSIAELDRGAREYLKSELPKRAATTPTTTTTTTTEAVDKIENVKLVQLAQLATGKVRVAKVDSLDGPTSKALQRLLVQLMSMFAADKAGGLDVPQLVKIYKTS